MSAFARRLIVSFLKQSIPVVILTLLMAPSAADAKPRLLLFDAGGRLLTPETSRQKVKRTVEVSINENGDLVLRRRDVPLTNGERLNYPVRNIDTRWRQFPSFNFKAPLRDHGPIPAELAPARYDRNIHDGTRFEL